MIISPPFLPETGLAAPSGTYPDPMIDAVDRFECAHGIYELLRFGRILAAQKTLAEDVRVTWMKVTWATGQVGYIDINDSKIQKFSDADFLSYMGWQKVSDANSPYYQAFYGRGLMQLTWPSLYDDYGKFRGFLSNNTGHYADPRITQTSSHHWSGPPTVDSRGHTHTDMRQWYPRYDPDIVVSVSSNACDSAGFFWIWKHFMGVANILRIADMGITTVTVGRMSILVNGGGNGYDERQQYAAYLLRYRGDTTESTTSETLNFARQRIVSHPHQMPTWGGTAAVSHVYVDFNPQNPA
ncbi:hypothetical protein [Paraburkholderia heleia]|uniref:hypothetical protein n=1 Tax=Paraburkholderia heleia TaxID=634127 RepID=UPI0005AB457D|nr:hypothetical protein [Paraburkholderia heleia]